MPSGVQQIETRPRPNCYLCGRAGELLHQGLTDFMFDAPGVWSLKKCPQHTCGLVWLDPFPVERDIPLAYQTYYTHTGGGSQPGTLKNLRGFLYNLYQTITSIPALMVGLQREKRQLRSMFLETLTPGKLLDVGCGDGGFLNRMRQRGWSVSGVDFDKQAIASAKANYGLEVHHGDIKSPGFQECTFDAITMNHVIEHVPAPVEVFVEARKLLKLGGRLVLATPNTASMGHSFFGQYWRGLEPPRHLHLFSRRTLAECSRRAQLDVVHNASTAANADVITGASFSILTDPKHRSQVQPAPSLSRTLKAIAFQYREHFSLKRDPDAGEEVVLVCAKKSP
jgi:2-polyprenyl-3-methyl-5-hydroxy-6-metoxy-1,4-benzoquinol methylase